MISVFRNKEFIKLLIGRLVSNMGDSLYAIAAMWLVQEMTNSTFYTGLVGFLTLFPQTMQFLVGPIIDKDKARLKKILISTQLLQTILIGIIPILYYLDYLNLIHVLIIMPIVSMINQFFYPAQNVALTHLLKKEELVHGNTLFTISYHGVDLVFKSIGGILIGIIGAVSLYVIDSIIFTLAMLLFLTIKIPYEKNKETKKNILKETQEYFVLLKEGFTLIFKSVLKWLFLISSFGNLIIGMVFSILPSFANRFTGPETYGFMLSAMSVGLLIGVFSASFLSRYSIGILTVILFSLGGVSWLISGFVNNEILVVLLFGFAWIPMGATNILLFTFIQSTVSKNMVGRVLTLITSVSVSLMPLGSMLGGILGVLKGGLVVYTISGSSLIIIAGYCLLHPTIRSIPKIKEINPEKYGLIANEEAVSTYDMQ